MKCNRCNSMIPDMSKVCPYCGKRFGKPEPVKPVDEQSETAHDFKGVTLNQPGLSPQPPDSAEPAPSPASTKVIEISKESDLTPEADQSERSPGTEEPPHPEVVEKYKTTDDFEPHALDLRGSASESDSEEDLPELMFRPPDEGDPKFENVASTLPDREAILYDPFHQTSVARPRKEKKDFKDYPDRITLKTSGAASSSESPSPGKESSIKESTRKPFNVLTGLFAIILALFMILKGGTWLLNWFELFNEELFTAFVVPLVERLEIGIMLIALWLIAAISRPLFLKILALLFAFAATVVYGLQIYLQFVV